MAKRNARLSTMLVGDVGGALASNIEVEKGLKLALALAEEGDLAEAHKVAELTTRYATQALLSTQRALARIEIAYLK